MAKLNDLTNKTFGSWKVLYRNGSTPNKASIWHCQCLKCGNEKDIVGYSLTQGKTKMCRSCSATQWQDKEYKTTDIVHNIYSGMMQRCYDSNSIRYKDYGGKGIYVCKEWKNNFQAFAKWSYDNGFHKGMSIERLDINKPYKPSNCTYIPLNQQAKNRSITCWVNDGEETLCFSDMCKKHKLWRSTVKRYANSHKISIQESFNHYINK